MIQRMGGQHPVHSRTICSYECRTRHHHEGIVREELRQLLQIDYAHTVTMEHSPLITFPLAVFLKNLRCVTTASVRERLRMVISISCTQLDGRIEHRKRWRRRRVQGSSCRTGA